MLLQSVWFIYIFGFRFISNGMNTVDINLTDWFSLNNAYKNEGSSSIIESPDFGPQVINNFNVTSICLVYLHFRLPVHIEWNEYSRHQFN